MNKKMWIAQGVILFFYQFFCKYMILSMDLFQENLSGLCGREPIITALFSLSSVLILWMILPLPRKLLSIPCLGLFLFSLIPMSWFSDIHIWGCIFCGGWILVLLAKKNRKAFQAVLPLLIIDVLIWAWSAHISGAFEMFFLIAVPLYYWISGSSSWAA